MANLFGILTAIVLALAALVAFKNKEAYDAGVVETANQKELLAESKKRLAAAKEVLAALPVERAGVDAEAEAFTTAEAAEAKKNADLKAEVDTMTTKIASNKEQLDGIREKTAKIGNINELATKLRATSSELEELTQSISGAEAKLANLTAQNATAEGQIKAGKTKFEEFNSGRSISSLKTRIRSIYPNWGFVTLASGNNAGVVANSTLDVVRGGETVAKLLVTAVESSTASASIVPDSLKADATLMVGDQVVPGQKSTAPATAN